MSEPAPLRIEGLVRRFATGEGEITVFDGLDLEVRAGEIVGLVGPSGSGKSSLLHAAGLLERPSAGRIVLAGEDAWALDDRARTRLRRSAIGFVYQFHHLLPELDAIENVAMPRLISGAARAAAHAEAQTRLESLGLGHRLRHRPAQLSGGEQQRVAIARALANRPKLILADEPTGNLDPATSQGVFAALVNAVREEGAAALVATHNHALAAHMDRVVQLANGTLAAR